MFEKCDHCHLVYEREPGFFLGAIYINYGLTALLAVAAYPLMLFGLHLSRNISLALTIALVVLLPVWFFRYARSIWLGFDLFFDPADPRE